MNTNLKIGLAVGLLVLVVFGMTVINRAVPEDSRVFEEEEKKKELATREVVGYDQQLAIGYDPNSPHAELRHHQGYYDRGEHQVTYWIWNSNPEPLRVTFVETTCGKCRFADLALVTVPVPVTGDFVEPMAALFGGAGANPNAVGDAVYYDRVRIEQAIPPASWKRFEAKLPSTFAEIPPAKSKSEPSWAVLRLNINVAESKSFTAYMGFQLPDMKTPLTVPFVALMGLSPMCEVYPTVIDFKDVGEQTNTVTETLYYVSSLHKTGGPVESRLPKPLPPNARGDKFLAFGEPIEMTADECDQVARKIGNSSKQTMAPRILGGYKIPLTLNRRAAGQQLDHDLGPTEKSIEIAPESGSVDAVPKVVVRANFLGTVMLEDQSFIDLGSYITKNGVSKVIRLVGEKPDLELESVPDQCEPNILKLEATSAPESRGGRIHWNAKISIEPNLGGGVLPNTAVAVFRIKGTGQLLRIPVRGKGGTS